MATLYVYKKKIVLRKPPNPCVNLFLNVHFVKYFFIAPLPDDTKKGAMKISIFSYHSFVCLLIMNKSIRTLEIVLRDYIKKVWRIV